MNWAIAAGLVTAGFALFFILLAVRLFAYRAASSDSLDAGETESFSLSRYDVMPRLLSGDDLEFLKSQPGYRPKIGARFTRDRKKIFRMYLQALAVDFHQLHARARRMVAVSPAENSPMVGALLRQQIAFWRTIAVIEMQLLFPGMSVDVRGLVQTMESMRALAGIQAAA